MPAYYYVTEKVRLEYKVEVRPPPADGSSAALHRRTPDGAILQRFSNLQREGSGTLTIDLGGKVGVADSPVWTVFKFEKKQAAEPVVTRELAIALAEPEVGTIAAPLEAKPGEKITLAVKDWTALVYDHPGGEPTALEELEPQRVSAKARAGVRWRVGGKVLPSRGAKVTFDVKEEHLGKAVEVEAWLKAPGSGAKATVVVPRLGIVGAGESDAPRGVPVGAAGSLRAVVAPSLAGELTWSASSDAVRLKPDGGTVEVEGARASKARDDVTISVKLVSDATKKTYEATHKLTVDVFETEEPKDGTVWLVGTTLPVKGRWKLGVLGEEDVGCTVERDPRLEGPFEPSESGTSSKDVVLGSEGRYRIKVGGAPPEGRVVVTAVALEVLELAYEGTEALVGLAAPELVRASSTAAPSKLEPCWYLRSKTPIAVKVKVKAPKDLTQAARVRLRARGRYHDDAPEEIVHGTSSFDDLEVTGEATLQALASGAEVPVRGSAKLEKVGAYGGRWLWAASVDDSERWTPLPGEPAPFRILVTYGPPRYNLPSEISNPRALTKHHVDAAARWAAMQDRNARRGIAYAVDNNLRHWVPEDEQRSQLSSRAIVVSDTPSGWQVPSNRKELEGRVRGGRRSVSSIVYTWSCDQELWGWRVFDGRTQSGQVGGQCMQQAALVVDVLGTLGLEAEIFYIRRVGRGAKTGLPMKQLMTTPGSTNFWNFHAIARVLLDDGSTWCYDGSFSSPPNRKNDSPDNCERVYGPFIDSDAWWAAWRYTAGPRSGQDVPADDLPREHVPRKDDPAKPKHLGDDAPLNSLAKGQFLGVPFSSAPAVEP